MTSHLNSTFELSVGQASCTGRKAQNEDAIGIRIPDAQLLTTKGAVAIIADGVSAAEAGREASETCVQNFLADYYSTPESWAVKKSVRRVMTALNRWLFGQSQHFADERRGYISTLSAVVFKSHSAHVFHVGDSRVYRLRENVIEQITRDHAMAISKDQSYLTRAMGLDLNLDVDYQKVDLLHGDIFFLSTDGVHNYVSEKDIVDAVSGQVEDYEQVCKNLLDLAYKQGSPDNLSCQILRIDSLPLPQIDDVVSRLKVLPFPPFLREGMILDRYRVVREIHASNRSQLYLVEDVDSGRQYCMKTPSINFEDDPAYIERFVMESWIGSRINNAHVIKVLETGIQKNFLYYLTEYINGITLSQWMLENPKPPVEQVVRLVDQISLGIRAMHRKETLHQDIKPDNIIIDKNGTAKILDFGSCYIAGVAEIFAPLERETALGTATYSAPEYTVNTRADTRADIFSLAVMSYEMLTGRLPFGGKLESCKATEDFLSTHYTPAYHLNPLVPVWIDGALRKALRFHPERRHREVSEFSYELQHPNNQYLEKRFQPLVERNPVLLWKIIAGVLLITQIIMFVFVF